MCKRGQIRITEFMFSWEGGRSHSFLESHQIWNQLSYVVTYDHLAMTEKSEWCQNWDISPNFCRIKYEALRYIDCPNRSISWRKPLMNLRGWVIIYRVVLCTRKSEVSLLVINLRNFTWYDDVSLLMIKIIETWQYKQNNMWNSFSVAVI